MKNLLKINSLLVIVISLFWAGCAATKVTRESYAGKYNYVISTPMGDQAGYIILTQEGNSYTGTMGSDQGSTSIENLVIEGNKLTGNFEFMSYSIDMSGAFNADVLEGKFVAEGYEIPFVATKEK